MASDCQACHGFGWIYAKGGHEQCEFCRGLGEQPEEPMTTPQPTPPAEEVAKKIANPLQLKEDRSALIKRALAAEDGSCSICKPDPECEREVSELVLTIDDWVFGHTLSEPQYKLLAECLAPWRTKLLAAERARWVAFADEKGEPRKVLGDLVLTEDGCVIPHQNVTVYHIDDTGKVMGIGYRFANTAKKWYSTREAALAAKGGQHG